MLPKRYSREPPFVPVAPEKASGHLEDQKGCETGLDAPRLDDGFELLSPAHKGGDQSDASRKTCLVPDALLIGISIWTL